MNTLQNSSLRTIHLLRTIRDEVLAIQQRQLPSEIPQVHGLECFCQHRRARVPGGDFFDLLAPGPGELTLAIGTLPMKGIAGPILMSGLQTTLHSLGTRGSDLPGMLAELNRIMWNIAPERTFATLFCARILPRDGLLHYVNAGHEAALLWRAGGRTERLEPHAPVLGLSRHSQFRRRTVRFEPGDALIALTEGSEAGAGSLSGGSAHDRDATRFRDLPGRIIEAAASLPGLHNLDRTVVVVHRNHPLTAAA
jgi:serine phosphatase RsbU (regulator of sigma subunit)